MAAAIGLTVLSTSAISGDANTVFIVQDSKEGPGNSLTIDQTEATNSLVAGDIDGFEPARQTGSGNEADITLDGEGGFVLLNQNSVGALVSNGNSATLFGGELATVILEQTGFGNVGSINVTGRDSTGILRQTGDLNDGSVVVTGTNSTGELIQNGDRNNYTLTVDGNNTSVIFTQDGNGVAPANGVGPSVFSNGGTVIINQTALP